MRRKTANYAKNRKLLIKLLGGVGLPPQFTEAQRTIQLEGVLPETHNVHHILDKKSNGSNGVENLSVMPVEGHKELTKYLSHVHEYQKKFVKEDRPYLKALAVNYGAYTMDDVRLFSLVVK